MSDKEYLIQMIGLFKVGLAVLSAADLSLLAWIVLHTTTASNALLAAAAFVAILGLAIIILLIVTAIRYAQRIRRL